MKATASEVRVLVTGFGPFGPETDNPSGRIAAELGGIVLPVAAEEGFERTRVEMNRRGATAVLALGLAAGREGVWVERRAVNEADYSIPDDFGRVLRGPVHGGGPAFLESRLGAPAAVARAVRECGVAARVSRDAGRYVCNHFYFLLLHHLDGRAIFLHLPRRPELRPGAGRGGTMVRTDDDLRAVRRTLRFLEQRR